MPDAMLCYTWCPHAYWSCEAQLGKVREERPASHQRQAKKQRHIACIEAEWYHSFPRLLHGAMIRPMPFLSATHSQVEMRRISVTCRLRALIVLSAGSLGFSSDSCMYAPDSRCDSTSMIFGATSLISASVISSSCSTLPSHSRRNSMCVSMLEVMAAETVSATRGDT